jgi:hypothetical protein
MLQESDCKEEQAKNRVKKNVVHQQRPNNLLHIKSGMIFFQLFKLISAIFL